MENFDHIHIFKTNICTDVDRQTIHELLDGDVAIEGWTLDTEDEDKVLRVVSCTLQQQQIIDRINSKGYICCELI
ncbi:hypothetical protein HQ865_09125 [Mucilaginibacter mali]|uniref:Uncharacterized protein n=1 Tax=Mucilaginibacter mali TaxID=2740462 RepID=A0A7D4QJU3_9SPHI|nr:hypothetical protein [Mucilaginibacter mali]QKJ29910.1 hypothetical protein HQ865_09125 [Mucilaginibacter mali]